MSDDTDDELVARYLGGDQDAFASLYARYRAPLYRYFLRQVGREVVDDLYQEVWMKTIRRLNSYQPEGRFQAYLYKIAHSVLMDEHKRSARRPVSEDGAVERLVDGEAPLEESVGDEELRSMLYARILELPVNQREVWLLRQETDLSLKDIADLTDATVEGVKSRLRYASDKLKAGMRRHVRA